MIIAPGPVCKFVGAGHCAHMYLPFYLLRANAREHLLIRIPSFSRSDPLDFQNSNLVNMRFPPSARRKWEILRLFRGRLVPGNLTIP